MIEGLVRVNLNPEAVESVVVELLLVALDSEFVAPYKFGLHAIHDLLLDPYEAENVFKSSSISGTCLVNPKGSHKKLA